MVGWLEGDRDGMREGRALGSELMTLSDGQEKEATTMRRRGISKREEGDDEKGSAES